MPIVIFEGPEASGKTTIIDALCEAWGSNCLKRSWGPRDSWLEYCGPLFEDLKACKLDPHLLVVWSRSWISRTVYNKMLKQGQSVPVRVTTELDNIIIASGGLLLLVEAPASVLAERRSTRDPEDAKRDHLLDPARELAEFKLTVRHRRWKHISGIISPEDNVRSIISLLVHKNPECRMISRSASPGVDSPLIVERKEEPIDIDMDPVSYVVDQLKVSM